MNEERILVLHCLDWPITAAGYRPEQSVAIVRANRVEACSAAARGSGVAVGMRRREVQRRDPAIEIVKADYARDVAMFEPVVKAVISLAPFVEVFEPGICMVPTLGPSRYYGGDETLMREMFKVVTSATGDLGAICQIGIADGHFAARLAARSSTIVPAKETPQFLAPHPISVLERPELQSLLGRLGIRTLGKFAEIEESHIAARFGVDGVEAHRLARGMDGHHVVAQPAPIDLVMSRELEPPAERIDIAAFTGRALVVQLINELLKRSLTCERVTIEAEMENGETLSRCWRFDGVCTEKSLTERVRWQLEGWCQRKREERSAGGIATLRLIPDQLRPNIGEQRDFWNATTASDERAARGFSRLQALLGPDAVQIAAVQGGRHPTEQAIFTAWGERVDEPKTCYPWPNSIPPPAPSVVHVESPPVELLDESGDVVQVSNRGLLSRQPARLRSTKKSERIIAWAGPWTSDEQWWDTERHKRRAFLQIVTESGTAHLVAVSGGNWQLDATYD